MSEELVLPALDGSNPLAFLTAIGVLRVSQLRWAEAEIELRWKKRGAWVPVLTNCPVCDPMEFASLLLGAPLAPLNDMSTLGKNITVSPDVFTTFAHEAFNATRRYDRRLADFCTSFGCEEIQNEKGDRIQYSQFCFITGSGHQDFLGTVLELRRQVTAEHLHHALFEAIDDRDKGLSFRWNPTDAKEYSLLWQDPSKTGVFSTWGANLFAFEALPLFPAMPVRRRLETTGFHREKGNKFPEFTWPVWEAPLVVDEVRSVLSLEELHKANPDTKALAARGIPQVFRSMRVRIPPDGANFKVSFRPSRAV